MAKTRFDQRFFASTRGRIIQLLRRGSRTVDELAEAVDLTDNGVRGHLATLERDGIVVQTGVRRGIGKPAFAYGLTAEADSLFPKPYGPVLAVERAVQILTELQQKLKLPWRTPKNMPLLEYWYNVAYAPFAPELKEQAEKAYGNVQWLEKGEDPKVQKWSEAQNRQARAYLDKVAIRPEIEARLLGLLPP